MQSPLKKSAVSRRGEWSLSEWVSRRGWQNGRNEMFGYLSYDMRGFIVAESPIIVQVEIFVSSRLKCFLGRGI